MICKHPQQSLIGKKTAEICRFITAGFMFYWMTPFLPELSEQPTSFIGGAFCGIAFAVIMFSLLESLDAPRT